MPRDLHNLREKNMCYALTEERTRFVSYGKAAACFPTMGRIGSVRKTVTWHVL